MTEEDKYEIRRQILQLLNAYEIDLNNEINSAESVAKALVITSKQQALKEIRLAIITLLSKEF